MKIALYSRDQNPSLPVITDELDRRGMEYTLNPESIEGFDLALSFGGDGTFLDTVRRIEMNDTPILGINSGRLGFMAAVALEDIPEAMDKLEGGDYITEERTLLSVSGGDIRDGFAVNEFTVQKKGTGMISADIAIDGEDLARYWADGVIISTSTGSTAYSMSVGGAILAPGCRCFIISPIAPHNLNIRPLVVPESSQITVRVSTRDEKAVTATLDNNAYSVDNGTVFEIEKARKILKVIRPAGSSFYQALRKKLYWGIDVRNNN